MDGCFLRVIASTACCGIYDLYAEGKAAEHSAQGQGRSFEVRLRTKALTVPARPCIARSAGRPGFRGRRRASEETPRRAYCLGLRSRRAPPREAVPHRCTRGKRHNVRALFENRFLVFQSLQPGCLHVPTRATPTTQSDSPQRREGRKGYCFFAFFAPLRRIPCSCFFIAVPDG